MDFGREESKTIRPYTNNWKDYSFIGGCETVQSNLKVVFPAISAQVKWSQEYQDFKAVSALYQVKS